MIGVPFNDQQCLGAITQMVASMVNDQDASLVELAQRCPTLPALIRYIRSLPQRDDDGEPADGPRVEACMPSQRLRIPAANPNCVERAALYLGASELIDPTAVRQLATLDTPLGLHTFPVENGAPVVLDPRVPRGCIDCGLALQDTGPVQIDTSDAIRWTADLASAGAKEMRNGPSKIRRARNAVSQLIEKRIMPGEGDVDAIGLMFALAEEAAQHLGTRAVLMVQTTAQAMADVTDEIAAQVRRNLAVEIANGIKIDLPTTWMRRFGQKAEHALHEVASPLLSELSALGIEPELLALVEDELNRDGLTLGPIANPPRLAASPTPNARKLPN